MSTRNQWWLELDHTAMFSDAQGELGALWHHADRKLALPQEREQEFLHGAVLFYLATKRAKEGLKRKEKEQYVRKQFVLQS